ncbi:unnamed protein product [Adineta steineri]|uniref:NAD(P)(+)--arginine ADP-ribosyltransferase n=1 Tax=Adineta steineri TaxID=433720 RepID=A0A815FT87_9BILA|nr:unnamed protein product [Adineta steineri]CAF3749143.1 unnamed protein product [Adineta steineri]
MTQSSGTSEFYYACRNGEVEKVRETLPAMTLEELDHIQANGSTALHAASYYGHIEIVKMLLKRGVSRSIQNKPHNCVPYDEAKNEDVKKLFLRQSSTARFADDGSGHIDWMKCDAAAEELAKEYRFRHTGFGWKNKHMERRIQFIRDEMSATDGERIGKFLEDAQEKQDPVYLLKAYTVESDFYRKLNKDLATVHFDQGTNSGITYFIDFFYNNPSFEQLSYKGKVYRGMCVTKHDLKQYRVGGKVMNKAFMSMTKDRTVAEEFAKSGVTDRQTQKGEHVKLSALCTYELINDRTGLDIEKLSEYTTEKEVLVGPYTAFEIRAIRPLKNQYVEIDLRECQKPVDDNEDEEEEDY